MSNLEKFKKVRAERDTEVDDIIRVNRKSSAQSFVDQVLARFNEQKATEVTLSSLGAAISKTVTIAEVVKHRVEGIHQVNEIKTIHLDDVYEPLEEFKDEQLENMTVQRKLTCFQIVLTKTAPKDTKAAGYQAPIDKSEIGENCGPDDLNDVPNDRRRRRNRKGGEKTEGDAKGDKDQQDKGAKPEGKDEESKGGDGAGAKKPRQRNKRRPKTARPEGEGQQQQMSASDSKTPGDQKPKEGGERRR